MYPALPEACKRQGSEVDHITPDVFEGGNDATNGAFLCDLCHKIKTYTDNREAKKSNRIRGVTGGVKKASFKKPSNYISPLSSKSPAYQRAKEMKRRDA
jgi:hypothetical protein